MKVCCNSLRKCISAFPEARAVSTAIAALHFYLGFSSLPFEFGAVRLQVWARIKIKPVLTCCWGQPCDVDPVLESVHVLLCKTGVG